MGCKFIWCLLHSIEPARWPTDQRKKNKKCVYLPGQLSFTSRNVCGRIIRCHTAGSHTRTCFFLRQSLSYCHNNDAVVPFLLDPCIQFVAYMRICLYPRCEHIFGNIPLCDCDEMLAYDPNFIRFPGSRLSCSANWATSEPE